ncbi:hypothetical protein [Pleionea sediminis]|uniref:hypothetical protein n=1 Tax=Pleionea sediminis TaxID=2569479 RepID=UPI0013DDDCE0|nr:hypothetical protein [Pleionea sediminis]
MATTKRLIDELQSAGVAAEPHLSSKARERIQVLAQLSLVDPDEDLYDSRFFAAWIGTWLISAKELYEAHQLSFPTWAGEIVQMYKHGLWPWGIDMSGKPLVR